MTYLHLTKDRKVSPRGLYQESRNRWIPTVPNSFGLPAGDSCPGKTPFCTSCYAVRSEQSQGVAEAMQHNLSLLLGASVDTMTVLLAEMIMRYQKSAERMGVALEDRIFRIHWDGDFFCEDYAVAWARVMRGTPQVQFWAYTRSFVEPVNVVPILAGVANLTLYLSADKWNIAPARRIVAEYPSVFLALCAPDYETGRALAPDRRSIVCPENAKKMPLMSRDGRGACTDCMLCPKGRGDVIFSTSHRENVLVAPPRVRVSHRPKRLPETPKRPLYCETCGVEMFKKPGPGRPPKFCKKECRWAAYRAKVAS